MPLSMKIVLFQLLSLGNGETTEEKKDACSNVKLAWRDGEKKRYTTHTWECRKQKGLKYDGDEWDTICPIKCTDNFILIGKEGAKYCNNDNGSVIIRYPECAAPCVTGQVIPHCLCHKVFCESGQCTEEKKCLSTIIKKKDELEKEKDKPEIVKDSGTEATSLSFTVLLAALVMSF